MNRERAKRQARALMDAARLTDWAFRFDRAKRRAGSCTHATRTITLSGPLVDVYDEETVRGVILHEIAHALVGPDHHHDAVWRRAARGLGAPDAARLPADLPRPQEPWVGTCPACGAQRRLFRAPRRVSACGACSRVFDPGRILAWTFEGSPADPGGSYAKELRSILRGRRRA
ncbi:SprT-like domain-containing protein [Actinomyces sp. B33]|uniref:SprT-like domain-containing protein n=1 Tax=Actinomyces sp. B33 TaxID=2942131 RepID=UPI002340459F|nr:SprT-like domain-containing protein [Actinomyces sp. B33]MDC4232449.1 SprT-like domain-containing protein [Actinomyces sp. B33]